MEQVLIPAGFSYNRKTKEYTDLYVPGTPDDLAKFALRFYGIDKLQHEHEMMHQIKYGKEQPA